MTGVALNAFRGLCTVLVLASAPAAARGEAPDLYLSGGIGAGYARNGSLRGIGTEVDYDLGRPIGTLGVGIERGRWRFELDGTYRANDVEVVFFDDGTPDVAPDSDSRITARSLAVSALYDFGLGWGFRPFLGVGVGGAVIDYEITEYIVGTRLLDDSDTVAAYQLVAGFGLPLTPRLEVLVDYRYWIAADIELETVDDRAFDLDYEVHSAMLNLRFRPQAVATRTRARDALRARGWYVGGHGGMSFAKDAEIKDNIANFDAFDVGPVATLAVGRTLGERWRLELEGARRSHEAELIDFNPEFSEDRAEGRVRARSVMANAIYEPTWNTPFTPYAGLGVGMAWSDWDVRLQASGDTYVNDRDGAAAVQVVFGAAAEVAERLELMAEFRYWMTGLFDLAEPNGRPMRTELTVSSLMLGLRYTLP